MIKIEETDERFEIRNSGVPGAGHGLFASELIKKGDYLEVVGVMVDVADMSHVCTKFANYYKLPAEPESEFRHAVIPLGYGALVRRANSPEKQNVELTHLPSGVEMKSENAGRVVYAAIKDIYPGEEVLSDYGSSFPSNDDLARWKQLLEINFYGLKKIKK